MAMAFSPIKLKLLIDTKAKKVIFAEAGKEFIDFLIYQFSLPLATVAGLLKEKNMVGSLGYLYNSIESLPDSCLQPGQTKNSLLKPRDPLCATMIPLTQPNYDLRPQRAYGCDEHFYVADVPNTICPACRTRMTCDVGYVPPFNPSIALLSEVGFVKWSSVSYIVLDNLEFMPMYPEYLMTVLKKFRNNEAGGVLEETVVDFGMEEGLKLLKLSLECKTVLTSFYYGNMGPKV